MADTSFIGSVEATGYFVSSGTQSLSGAGAIDVTNSITEITSTGATDAVTLADGEEGQHKYIIHIVDGGSAIITPSNLLTGTTLTMAEAGDSVHLLFTNGTWCVVGNNGTAIA